MYLAKLIIGNLTPEQLARLKDFERAAAAIGAIIQFGDLNVTYSAGQPTFYGLKRTTLAAHEAEAKPKSS
jgi:hypothetical protein